MLPSKRRHRGEAPRTTAGKAQVQQPRPSTAEADGRTQGTLSAGRLCACVSFTPTFQKGAFYSLERWTTYMPR